MNMSWNNAYKGQKSKTKYLFLEAKFFGEGCFEHFMAFLWIEAKKLKLEKKIKTRKKGFGWSIARHSICDDLFIVLCVQFVPSV